MHAVGFIFGADQQAVIACNTAHLLLPKLDAELRIRLVSLVEATVAHIASKGFKRVGIVASPTTVKSQLYSQPLQAIGITLVTPSTPQMVIIEQVIRGVIAGNARKHRQQLRSIIQSMLSDCEAVVLGCTELSVLAERLPHCIDPLDIVTRKLLDKAK